jgi:nucleotide-binding universal stress UspA family protein
VTTRTDEFGSAPPAAQGPGGTRAADAAGRLGFPDLPRLEPDQLLVQLVDRADDALAAHRRPLRPVRHLVHGSASSYCREYSRCPVVVVPPGEGAGR